jgi:UDP-N-acetylglucosamine--N-acetylmuramyl-(pentapeptide) pyrophosphoryl-undecaprenol N-acetylglucosamine transferase
LQAKTPAERFHGRQQSPLRMLVLGGSLGAKVLNELIPRVIKSLPEETRVEVWHQTGKMHFESTRDLYQKYTVDSVKVVPFIEDMAEAYSWADIVLCRAGALTISELCIMGLASILVPYPYAVDDHQTANARYLSDSGAAILIPQTALNEQTILDLLSRFCRDRESLVKMAVTAQQRAMPHSTRDIGNLCMEAIYA